MDLLSHDCRSKDLTSHHIYSLSLNQTAQACTSFTEAYSRLYFAYRRLSDFSSPAVDSAALHSVFGCSARLCFKTFSTTGASQPHPCPFKLLATTKSNLQRGPVAEVCSATPHFLEQQTLSNVEGAEIQQKNAAFIVSAIANFLINNNCGTPNHVWTLPSASLGIIVLIKCDPTVCKRSNRPGGDAGLAENFVGFLVETIAAY